MDSVVINKLRCRGVIGVNDWERAAPQEILVTIRYGADLSRVCASDDVTDTVDYGHLSRGVLTLVSEGSRRTIEALAEDVAGFCLAQDAIGTVMVRIEKPWAERFADSVAVEIERSRDG